ELMIVRPASSGTFTSDRAAIDTALAKAMEDSKLDLQSPRVIDDQRFVNSIRSMNLSKASRLMAERQRQKIEQRLGTIRAAVTTLSELPGRKFVIVVTESLPAQPGREGCAIGNHVAKAAPDVPGEYMRADYVDLTPEFQDIARTASANGITIYGFQPEVGSPVAPVDTAGHPDAGAARALANSEDGMNVLTELTGEEENGVHRARFTVHYAISGERLDFVSGVDREQLVEIPDTDWERARSQQWTHSLHFNTRLGPHRLAVGVLDSSSMTWGINALTIDAN